MRRMRKSRTELIECYDCGNAVSFSAASCPHCGSSEPAGPYQFSARERRRHRIEARNDRSLIVIAAVSGAIGVLYGAGSGGGTLGAIAGAFGYGLVGVLIGVPIAFAVNMTRGLLH
jgi:hypothetical protein